jgi:hypothetical protein
MTARLLPAPASTLPAESKLISSEFCKMHLAFDRLGLQQPIVAKVTMEINIEYQRLIRMFTSSQI